MESGFAYDESMNTVENLYVRLDDEISSLSRRQTLSLASETNGDPDLDWREIQKFNECIGSKLDAVVSSKLFIKKLQNMLATMELENPKPFAANVEPSEWQCIDGATQFYNALMMAHNKYVSWAHQINDFMKECLYLNLLPSEEEKLQTAELLCEVTNGQRNIPKHYRVRILRTEGNKTMVCTNSDIAGANETGLLQALKTSLQSSQGSCPNCRQHEDHHCWVPNIYLRPLNSKMARSSADVLQVKDHLVSLWDDYLKQTGQLIMDLLFSTFKRWSDEKNTMEFTGLHHGIQENLQSFFSSLEGSLANDWECQIHYELILQQLSILRENISKNESQKGADRGLKSRAFAERVGKLALEKRIIFKLLEKYELMIAYVNRLKTMNNRPINLPPALSDMEPKKGMKLSTFLPREPTESTSRIPKDISKLSSKKSDQLSAYAPIEPMLFSNRTSKDVSEMVPNKNHNISSFAQIDRDASLSLSKKPPSCPQPLSGSNKKRHSRNYENEIPLPPSQFEKIVTSQKPMRNSSEKHQRHRCMSDDPGRFYSNNLSSSETFYSVDSFPPNIPTKYVLLRPKDRAKLASKVDSFPMRTRPSGERRMRSVSDSTSLINTGYIILTQPGLRERITAVCDTKNRTKMSVYKAMRRGLIGFKGGFIEDEVDKMNIKEQKNLFFALDTARQKRLTFKEAIKAGVIQYDSSSNEPLNFPEYSTSQWNIGKTNCKPIVYRVERVYGIVERNGKLGRDKQKWFSFQEAINGGMLDRKTGELLTLWSQQGPKSVHRISFVKAIAWGLIQAVPLRHCLIDKLPSANCIFVDKN